jgi:beta-lactamase class A
MKRRDFVWQTTSTFVAASFTHCTPNRSATPSNFAAHTRALEHLEHGGGRLGAAIFDTQTGAWFGHRLDERFGMCSTFKLPLAAMVLHAAEQGRLPLETELPYTAAELVPHAPITEQHLSRGSMPVVDLARAAQVQSDNVAANLLLRELGGPSGFTQWCRQLGDEDTRLDRLEPELNLVSPGDERDTSTPRAFATLVSKFFGEGLLSHASQASLREWMTETTTGARRLRAGFPPSWQTGDKTGTNTGDGVVNRYNDVACIWFTNRGPLVVACFFEGPVQTSELRAVDEAVLSRVGYIAAHWAHSTLQLNG